MSQDKHALIVVCVYEWIGIMPEYNNTQLSFDVNKSLPNCTITSVNSRAQVWGSVRCALYANATPCEERYAEAVTNVFERRERERI